MQKQWSSFRITLLLYLVVLILPFSFYFVYSSFETIKTDTLIVRQSSWIPGAIEHTSNENDILQIDKNLNNIAQWAKKNADSKLYIGAKSLSQDLSDVTACWSASKKDLSAQKGKCYDLAENMAVNIEKMVYLKQKEIINVFYISLLLAMIFTLLLIYFVRVYIHRQMKKHAIHDHDTDLFNQKFFLAELQTAVARAKRENSPLSIFFLSVTNLKGGIYDAKQQKHLAQKIAHVISMSTRDSDTVCRYDEEHFAILMPMADREAALHLETRLKTALSHYEFHVDPQPEFDFITTQFDNSETEESFITRSKN
ncbi:hypothetical protein YH65_01535 [Sulfurovum lithotrophicum]|uniref:diguanylate cyclase n=1 Tax=Sulfurovum lithotrophicum TaxID=206403 RepID=A0A7U4RPW3_9BACT|nr:diguanylate cyclase [Sulfurovum lithotrophicum]AKF24223.1 hypothetical protein YH65_01535 [Sulfurovum lithotrophicum]